MCVCRVAPSSKPISRCLPRASTPVMCTPGSGGRRARGARRSSKRTSWWPASASCRRRAVLWIVSPSGKASGGGFGVVRLLLLLEVGDLRHLGVDLRIDVGGCLVALLRDDERADLLAQLVDLLLQARVLDLFLADGGGVLRLLRRLARGLFHLVEETHDNLPKANVGTLVPQRQPLVSVREAGGAQRIGMRRRPRRLVVDAF